MYISIFFLTFFTLNNIGVMFFLLETIDAHYSYICSAKTFVLSMKNITDILKSVSIRHRIADSK